jgi:hypothetical protein
MHGSDQYCSICTERTNMDRIIECEHIWSNFAHEGDENFLGTKCDFSPDNDPHTVDSEDKKENAITYHCTLCNAVSCESCVDPNDDPLSDASD